MSTPELARIVKLDRLPARLVLEADETERAALARRFGLPGVAALRAEVALGREGDVIDARGTISARFEQLCAVSGEPFDNWLEERLALRFVPPGDAPDEESEQEFAPDAPDEIEYENAAFDLGEAVAQSFGLLIDPFATGPDADTVRREAGIVDESAPSGPFAALAALRKDR